MLIAVASLGAAAAFGGWEWALVSFAVLALLWRAQASPVLVVSTLAVGVFWLAAFHWTGDRRLFFPFTMQLAVQSAYLIRRGGLWMAGLFLLIRVVQAATAGVLLVELLVAAAILGIVPVVFGSKLQGAWTRVFAGMLGSLLAFAGLAF